jgi:hypothetical protein
MSGSRECEVCGHKWLGTEHDECPNRYERVVSEPCECKTGCDRCNWTGTNLRTVGGHKWVIPIRSAAWRPVKNG